MAAGHPVHDKPPDVQHAGVVVDVQKGDLVIILSQYEEKGVHELDEFGEVVPPQDIHDLGEGDKNTFTSLFIKRVDKQVSEPRILECSI